MIHGLAEVRRALCRDGSHVVLVAEPPANVELGSRLASEICDAGRVEIAHLAGLEPAAAERHLLAAFGVPTSGVEPELRLRREIERLAKLEATIVLIVPEALSVKPHVLRQLGTLARMAGKVLRLAFLVERDDRAARDPAAQIVGSLGTGAAKIELFARLPGEDAGVATPPQRPAPMPPVVPVGPADKPKRPRPIPVRPAVGSHSGLFGSRRLAVAALLAMVAGLAMIFSETPLSELPVSVAAAEPEVPVTPAKPVAPPAQSAELPMEIPVLPRLVEASTPPPVEVARVELPPPPKKEDLAPIAKSVPVAKPVSVAKPVPKPTVEVSFNALPWADLEVDGRSVGVTPISGLRLEKGTRRVRATFPDGRIVDRDLQVDEFQNRFRIE